MQPNDSTPQPAASTSNLPANPAEAAVLRPQDPIEGTTGTGTVTDPAASDKRPPAYGDLRAFLG